MTALDGLNTKGICCADILAASLDVFGSCFVEAAFRGGRIYFSNFSVL